MSSIRTALDRLLCSSLSPYYCRELCRARTMQQTHDIVDIMARIPRVLHEHIDTAFPEYVCLVGTVSPDGFAQISPRGSTMVFDDEHFGLWERGKGTSNSN